MKCLDFFLFILNNTVIFCLPSVISLLKINQCLLGFDKCMYGCFVNNIRIIFQKKKKNGSSSVLLIRVFYDHRCIFLFIFPKICIYFLFGYYWVYQKIFFHFFFFFLLLVLLENINRLFGILKRVIFVDQKTISEDRISSINRLVRSNTEHRCYPICDTHFFLGRIYSSVYFFFVVFYVSL